VSLPSERGDLSFSSLSTPPLNVLSGIHHDDAAWPTARLSAAARSPAVWPSTTTPEITNPQSHVVGTNTWAASGPDSSSYSAFARSTWFPGHQQSQRSAIPTDQPSFLYAAASRSALPAPTDTGPDGHAWRSDGMSVTTAFSVSTNAGAVSTVGSAFQQPNIRRSVAGISHDNTGLSNGVSWPLRSGGGSSPPVSQGFGVPLISFMSVSTPVASPDIHQGWSTAPQDMTSSRLHLSGAPSHGQAEQQLGVPRPVAVSNNAARSFLRASAAEFRPPVHRDYVNSTSNDPAGAWSGNSRTDHAASPSEHSGFAAAAQSHPGSIDPVQAHFDERGQYSVGGGGEAAGGADDVEWNHSYESLQGAGLEPESAGEHASRADDNTFFADFWALSQLFPSASADEVELALSQSWDSAPADGAGDDHEADDLNDDDAEATLAIRQQASRIKVYSVRIVICVDTAKAFMIGVH